MKNIDWSSKIIDLVIVIVGISIAFQLNSWNESKKSNKEALNYIKSFHEENQENKLALENALEFVIKSKENIDSLSKILISKNYQDSNILNFTISMMAYSNFIPSVTTMDNIKASGEFELIQDVELRKKLIKTYNSYNFTRQSNQILTDYINNYVAVFFHDNINFVDFSSIEANFYENPKFLNNVIGYLALVGQQVESYNRSLIHINALDSSLSVVPN